MPFCPVCRYEYRPGFTECADCHVKLVDELPPENEAEEKNETHGYSSDDFVTVYVAANEIEAKVVKAALEGAGIAVWDRSHVLHMWKSITVGPLAPEELLILSSRADEASKIIQATAEQARQ